jgi:hypothetical protein
MSDWGWVGLAYAVAYGSLAAFVAMTAARVRAARRRLGEG